MAITVSNLLILATLLMVAVVLSAPPPRPEYVKPCKRNDPKLTQCFTGSINHLKPYLAKGIPEIQMPAIEPYRLDELSLSLTSGPQGYKITLRDMDIFGISNFTLTNLKMSKRGSPFEGVLRIPKLTMSADYKSSGVLLILPASGSGIFHNTMRDVTATVRGTVSFRDTKDGQIMHVDTLQVNVDCKTLSMSITKAFQNAPILREATNLFLKENGKEVFDAMKPEMNSKLAAKFLITANTMLLNTPIEQYYI